MLSPEIASPTEMMPSDNISARTPPRLLYASLNPVLLAAAEGIWQGRVGSMPRSLTSPILNSRPSNAYTSAPSTTIFRRVSSGSKGTNPRRANSSFAASIASRSMIDTWRITWRLVRIRASTRGVPVSVQAATCQSPHLGASFHGLTDARGDEQTHDPAHITRPRLLSGCDGLASSSASSHLLDFRRPSIRRWQ